MFPFVSEAHAQFHFLIGKVWVATCIYLGFKTTATKKSFDFFLLTVLDHLHGVIKLHLLCKENCILGG